MKRIRVQLDEKQHKRLETLATRIMRSPSWTRRYTRLGLAGLVDGRMIGHRFIIERDSKGATSTGATPVRVGTADCLTTPTRAASVTARKRRTKNLEGI